MSSLLIVSEAHRRCRQFTSLPSLHLLPHRLKVSLQSVDANVMQSMSKNSRLLSSQAVDRHKKCYFDTELLAVPRALWRRDYFDVALLVGNLNSHGIIPAFEK